MGKSLVKPAITVIRRYNEVIIKEEELVPYFPLPPLLITVFFSFPSKCKKLAFLVGPRRICGISQKQKEPRGGNLMSVCQDWRIPGAT